MAQLKTSLVLIVYPVLIIKPIFGQNNLLIEDGPNHSFLSPLGVIIFYGTLLTLTYLIPIIFKTVKNQKNK